MSMRWLGGACAVVIALGALGCQREETPETGDGTSDVVAATTACRTKRGAKPCSPATEHVKAVSAEVLAIKRLLQPGRHDFERAPRTSPADAMSLVRTYLAKKYAGDEDILSGYAYDPKLAKLPVDQRIAGVFASPDAAIDLAVKALSSWNEGDTKQTEAVRAHLVKLASLGVAFGTDGFEQNGCASPTPFLLVIDPVGKTVDGIDLGPCEE